MESNRKWTSCVVALTDGRDSDKAVMRMAAGAAEIAQAPLRIIATTPLIERPLRVPGRTITPWQRMEQRERFLAQQARDLLQELRIQGAHVGVSFGSRLATATTLQSGSVVRLVVAAPRPALLRGWGPTDMLIARELRERLLWVDQPLSTAEGAPFPDTYGILRQHALYAHVPAADVRHAARALDVVHLKPHEMIIREGQPNRAFWLILEGSLGVSIGSRRERIVGRGGFVGGFSLLAGRAAAASVVTLTPVRALVASEHGFRHVAGHELVRLRLRTFYANQFADDKTRSRLLLTN
jgi:hypothetical protein